MSKKDESMFLNDIVFEMEMLVCNTFSTVLPDKIFKYPFVNILGIDERSYRDRIVISFSVSLINNFLMGKPMVDAIGFLDIDVDGHKIVVMKNSSGLILYEGHMEPGKNNWEIMFFDPSLEPEPKINLLH